MRVMHSKDNALKRQDGEAYHSPELSLRDSSTVPAPELAVSGSSECVLPNTGVALTQPRALPPQMGIGALLSGRCEVERSFEREGGGGGR